MAGRLGKLAGRKERVHRCTGTAVSFRLFFGGGFFPRRIDLYPQWRKIYTPNLIIHCYFDSVVINLGTILHKISITTVTAASKFGRRLCGAEECFMTLRGKIEGISFNGSLRCLPDACKNQGIKKNSSLVYKSWVQSHPSGYFEQRGAYFALFIYKNYSRKLFCNSFFLFIWCFCCRKLQENYESRNIFPDLCTVGLHFLWTDSCLPSKAGTPWVLGDLLWSTSSWYDF